MDRRPPGQRHPWTETPPPDVTTTHVSTTPLPTTWGPLATWDRPQTICGRHIY